jgi:hypothetical protein
MGYPPLDPYGRTLPYGYPVPGGSPPVPGGLYPTPGGPYPVHGAPYTMPAAPCPAPGGPSAVPPGHHAADEPLSSRRENLGLILLLVIGLPVLLLGSAGAVAMVLTDTGQGTVATEADDRPEMTVPSENGPAHNSPGQNEPTQNDPAPNDPALNDPAQNDPALNNPAQNDVAQSPAQQPQGRPQDQERAGQGGTSTATIGRPITLQGLEPGLRMSVTVTQVFDPATPAGTFTKPQAGQKFVAVQVRLANVGQAVYDDAPDNGARLIDAQGQQYSSAIARVTEGQGFQGSATINPGDSRMGVIVFEVPRTARPAKFQFALNSGFAAQTGEWALTPP